MPAGRLEPVRPDGEDGVDIATLFPRRHDMNDTKKLTRAAQRDLEALRRGESVPDLRYGPYRQLLDAGYITGPQSAPLLVDDPTDCPWTSDEECAAAAERSVAGTDEQPTTCSTHERKPALTGDTNVDVLVHTRGGWSQYAILTLDEAKRACSRNTGPIVAVYNGVAVAVSDKGAAFTMPNAQTTKFVGVDDDSDPQPSTDVELEETLIELIRSQSDDNFDELAECDVSSYSDAGVMTNDHGFVVRMRSGAEFQVTIVQSARASR